MKNKISNERLEEVARKHSSLTAREAYETAKELLALRNAREGWKLVPIDPTEEMIEAHIDEQILSGDETGISLENPSDCYRAMINAAPRVPK